MSRLSFDLSRGSLLKGAATACSRALSPAAMPSSGKFAPFWEFVSGPLNAGTFGHVRIDGVTQAMTVTLRDAADNTLWSIDLEPELA